MIERLIKSICKHFGIEKEMVDKVKTIVDNIDVEDDGQTVRITFKVDDATVILKKNKINEGE
jgi:hypothetical protein